ncbi:MAG: hypothetical protein M1823_004892 [Watsoniomyces obsoletus]|nr:MAG: hypothetical protein M1823_004892 [Watsoniomyces obsoletus]
MADPVAPSISPAPPSLIPQKRPIEDLEHAPSVPPPPKPDPHAVKTTTRAPKQKTAMAREPREKKETLKKREAKGGVGNDTAAGASGRGGGKKGAAKEQKPQGKLTPLRYSRPPPHPSDFEQPRGPVFVAHHTVKGPNGETIQFYETTEHVYNRKGFRYTHCIADPKLPSSQYYRQCQTEPFIPRFSFEDSAAHLYFNRLGTQVTTDKGFRMTRTNVGVREGRWYWECKILCGVQAPRADRGSQSRGAGGGSGGASEAPVSRGHVRMGWARREASLDAPVGFDAYSYGLRDVAGQKTHMSRPKDFFPPGEDIREGDVIGLEIKLPSLALHRRVVQGRYNPAVDADDRAGKDDDGEPMDIIRDRLPIRYKSHKYFEQFEYQPTKELEELANPSPAVKGSPHSPNPTHPLCALRTLPDSYIRVYKNGQLMGTPFTDLFAFLPPASKPSTQPGAREGVDDGMLGYFPAVSVFRGGAAEINLGPNFWYPPPLDEDVHPDPDAMDLDQPRHPSIKPVSQRYEEQIAEDASYDLLDEVYFSLQDQKVQMALQQKLEQQQMDGAGDAMVIDNEAATAPASLAGGIKEVVQEIE